MYRITKIRLPLKGLSYLTFIVLVYSIAATMLIPIFPLYIKGFGLNNANVGYITALVSVLLLFYTLLTKKLLQKIKKVNLIRIGLLGSSVTILILTIIPTIKYFLLLEVFRTFFIVAIYITMGLFVREYATTKTIGKAEGMYFSVHNIGYLLGPLFGGLLATAYSFNTVFVVSAIPQFLLTILLFIIPLKEKATIQRHNFKFLDYFKNKELTKLYIVTFGLVTWWVLLYTYLPLFADTNGFSSKIIGYALFSAVIPLIILEVPIGKLADTKGFRKYISLGFLIIALITFFTFFAGPIYTIIFLVAATIGTAFIEPLVEAYFFEEVKTKEKENNLYPVYKTSSEASHLIAPLILSTVLLYFDFRGLFLFAAFFMLLFSLIALKLKR